ncbi:hypothetical protein FIU94_11305 [Sulfitobacter sp. THAF37]|uniref:hypothetical protein n=1 Tax=Sulfitobacter sp. THAF37 TaxID=2587855 RepID=UPI001267893E|nr:hypothetical protein [Sulfitobacter sp. THAF37]QFT59410.1 hypothetical protein FIU94_11305 [Sulfitobacter sp. THAF37]
MIEELSHREFVLALTADAVIQARIVRDQLFDIVIPELAPHRRSLAVTVRRGLTASTFLSEDFLDELGALIEFLRIEIEKGIETIWVPDEYNVHGGHEQRIFDAHARTLAVAVGHFIDLFEIIAELIDSVEAERLIEDLSGA